MGDCIHREFADPRKGWNFPDPNSLPVGTEWKCPQCGMTFVIEPVWNVVTLD